MKDRLVAPPSSAAGSAVRIRSRGYLPHWNVDGGTYFITFRLADSLPSPVRDEIIRHRIRFFRARESRRDLLGVERVTEKRLSGSKIESYLDAGSGECLMRQPSIADVVSNALRHWDGKRYGLHAWCVMPNHVHVLCSLGTGESLGSIVGAWKSWSARQTNQMLNRNGCMWQREYYDHLIRNEAELRRACEYIRDNPLKAELKAWKWVYVSDEMGPAAEDGGAT